MSCPFRKHHHPGANLSGSWEGSISQQELANCIHDKSNKPFYCLQYGLHATLVNGVWTMVKITTGPKPPNPKVCQLPFSSLGNHFLDHTPALSLCNRNESGVEGFMRGKRVSVLIDTGVMDYNYISRTLVDKMNFLLPAFPSLST